MAEPKTVSDAVNAALATLGKKNRAEDTLSSVLQEIDEACKNAVKELGEALCRVPGWESLAWLFGQYRGTILTGKRDFAPIFSHPKLGSESENRLLLGIYWHTYGLGSTMGELFEKTLMGREIGGNTLGVKRAAPENRWSVLCVTPGSGDDPFSCSRTHEFLPGTTHKVDTTTSTIPRHWREALLGDAAWEKVASIVAGIPPEVDSDGLKQFLELNADFRALGELLHTSVQLVRAQLAWNEGRPGGTNLASMLQFAGCEDGRASKREQEEAITSLLVATQLLALYWRWSEKKGFAPGPLVVAIPRPGVEGTGKLQPRFGFASVFTGDRQCSECLRLVMEVLPAWASQLDHASSRIKWSGASTLASRLKSHVQSLGEQILGERLTKFLIDEVGKRHPGEKTAAELLLERIFPVLAEIDRLAPKFVHEGRRFGVTVAIGLPYHEQVLGEPLGSVRQFLDDYQERVPKGCKDDRPGGDCDLLHPLIDSCYSLLDWSGVVLFGALRPSNTRGVEFSRLLRLPPAARDLPPSDLYTTLTRRHSGLFCIDVDRSGTIRVYYEGDFLLYKQRGPWAAGSAVEDLCHLLRSKMSDITGSEFNEDLSFLKPFSRLLLRISEEPGVGALFVIDAGGAALERLCRISPPPQTIWETLEPFNREQSGGDEQAEKQLEILYRLATMDGATLIRLAGDANAAVEQRWMRAKIFPRLLVTERFDLQKFWTTLENGKWAQWTEILSYGAKRNSAFALAMNTRDDASRLLVITVSADGPISFMIGGEDPVSKWPGDSRQSAKAPARVG